jgi:ADP-dependent NAD(P)H-hydrate dehydratase / NAD(P)H-hydrate epimerase
MVAAYSVTEIRRAEEATGEELSSGALMQRAASGLAGVLLDELRGAPAGGGGVPRAGGVRGRRVLLVVGSGNNGGDALWAGVRLLRRGVRVSAWRTADTAHAEGWAAFLGAGGRELDALAALGALPDVDLVVDGVLGIGGRGGLRGPVAVFADACADLGARVVAVDLPSGLEADSCRIAPSFVADVTVTFGGRKACQVLQPAASRCGRVVVVEIGLDLAAPLFTGWAASDVGARYPWPGPTSDKYGRGAVGVDTGSAAYPGAAVLSTMGAVYGGAGFVRYVGPAAEAVVAALPNVVTAPGRVQAWLLGCGWGARPDGPEVVAARLAEGLPTVLDADSLTHVRGLALRDDVLLTPHAGELASLLGVERGEVEADPLAHVHAAASGTGATVLLKGATQYVAEPSGRVRIAVPGPAWTAQAGSGDTLAGLCAAMLASGRPAAEAALLGASLQAITTRNFPGPRPPQDLARLVAEVIPTLR